MDLSVIFANFYASWLKIYPLVLTLLSGLFLLSVGLFIARFFGWLITLGLKLLQIDRGAKSIGLNNFLEKGEIKRTPAELLGDLVYWLILFVAVIGVANFFGLKIESVLTLITDYLATIFLALFVLGLGAFLATLIAGIALTLLTNFGIVGARVISRIIYYIVIIFSFLTALGVLGISSEAFKAQIGVIIGAVGLAAAIAFGLGCKDMAADFLHNLFKSK